MKYNFRKTAFILVLALALTMPAYAYNESREIVISPSSAEYKSDYPGARYNYVQTFVLKNSSDSKLTNVIVKINHWFATEVGYQSNPQWEIFCDAERFLRVTSDFDEPQQYIEYSLDFEPFQEHVLTISFSVDNGSFYQASSIFGQPIEGFDPEVYIKEYMDDVTLKQDVIDKTLEITAGLSTKREKAQAIYQWMASNVEYSLNYSQNKPEDTIKVLKGQCIQFSELFRAMCKVVDIPARNLLGYAAIFNPLSSAFETTLDVTDETYHMWNEFYDENCGWVMADATFDVGKTDPNTFEYFMRGYGIHIAIWEGGLGTVSVNSSSVKTTKTLSISRNRRGMNTDSLIDKFDNVRNTLRKLASAVSNLDGVGINVLSFTSNPGISEDGLNLNLWGIYGIGAVKASKGTVSVVVKSNLEMRLLFDIKTRRLMSIRYER